MENKPDFSVYGGGTIYMLKPLSQEAKDWVSEHIPGDAQTFGGAIAVEHRYISDIVTGIINDGLTVDT